MDFSLENNSPIVSLENSSHIELSKRTVCSLRNPERRHHINMPKKYFMDVSLENNSPIVFLENSSHIELSKRTVCSLRNPDEKTPYQYAKVKFYGLLPWEQFSYSLPWEQFSYSAVKENSLLLEKSRREDTISICQSKIL